MKSFKIILTNLQKIYHKFDEQSNALKSSLLKEISAVKIPLNSSLLNYHHLLLFIAAHPSNEEQLKISELELNRISSALKNISAAQREKFINSGLPYTAVLSSFSQDLLKWMINEKNYKIAIDSFGGDKEKINTALSFTLPSIEKEITTLELSGNKLFDKLNVKPKNRIQFLLNEFDKLEHETFIKDHFFNELGMYVNVTSLDQRLSKAYNRIELNKVYHQEEILKNFDHVKLFNTKLPSPKKCSAEELKNINAVVKNALILLQRETDPVSYIDENSIRLYELERGISIAIYGMIPERQLPMESYVGYTLFKNGFPAAYGGGWVFGRRSLFGINIFEWFRGGESGYMLCQLLRVYRQAFGVDYFEVEPYQYGKGNLEGIKSGAFWFYYRFGFKPVNEELKNLASKESELISTTKGYRTSATTLKKFTESNLALNFETKIPISLWEIREKITEMIGKKFYGNRKEAIKKCSNEFLNKAKIKSPASVHEKNVLVDVALIAEAMKMNSSSKLKFLSELIKTKPADLYSYQRILLKIFN